MLLQALCPPQTKAGHSWTVQHHVFYASGFVIVVNRRSPSLSRLYRYIYIYPKAFPINQPQVCIGGSWSIQINRDIFICVYIYIYIHIHFQDSHYGLDDQNYMPCKLTQTQTCLWMQPMILFLFHVFTRGRRPGSMEPTDSCEWLWSPDTADRGKSAKNRGPRIHSQRGDEENWTVAWAWETNFFFDVF